MKLRPYGDTAVLVESDAATPAQLRALLAGQPGIHEAVPAARTLLVEYDPHLWTTDTLVARLSAPTADTEVEARHVDLPVRYDGPDLDDVAAITGRTVTEVVALHSAPIYTVAFCGFSPGFAYLSGLDPRLEVARLDQPRTNVPSGAVAIAGGFSAVYPRSSPGGWRLLGSTDVALWDLARQPPALLTPGTTVRFVRS